MHQFFGAISREDQLGTYSVRSRLQTLGSHTQNHSQVLVILNCILVPNGRRDYFKTRKGLFGNIYYTLWSKIWPIFIIFRDIHARKRFLTLVTVQIWCLFSAFDNSNYRIFHGHTCPSIMEHSIVWPIVIIFHNFFKAIGLIFMLAVLISSRRLSIYLKLSKGWALILFSTDTTYNLQNKNITFSYI